MVSENKKLETRLRRRADREGLRILQSRLKYLRVVAIPFQIIREVFQKQRVIENLDQGQKSKSSGSDPGPLTERSDGRPLRLRD